jgi:hypothetical protein
MRSAWSVRSDVKRGKEARERRAAERADPRPALPAPMPDAPWLPVMNACSEILSKSTACIPPARNIELEAMLARRVKFTNLHAFSSTNQGESTAMALPAPELWALRTMDNMEVAEMIERHIDFIDPENGRSVHLAMPFVCHFMKREDDLPTIVTVATQPIVLADGVILAMHDGLDRERGIVFKIHKKLIDMLPARADCDDESVGKAMQFLTDEWLVDVACDYTGKCTLIAAALTMIERSILDQRPVFFVSAGQRGCGKTTTLTMLIEAATGIAPAAATWSTDEEERRKAVFSYFLAGLTYMGCAQLETVIHSTILGVLVEVVPKVLVIKSATILWSWLY